MAGKHGAKIIDLAAGTGKLTEALAAREERYDILAVEPHDGMRDVLAAKALPRVKVVAGTAEAIPCADEAVDAVVVGQVCDHFAFVRMYHDSIDEDPCNLMVRFCVLSC